MPTIQQILDYVDRKYPNTETVPNKVSDLNDIHLSVYVDIQKLKNEIEIYEFFTANGFLTYMLPANCRIENIITDGVKVARDATVTSSTKFDVYRFAGANDNIESGNHYFDGGKGMIGLISNGEPITAELLSVRIFYYKRPAALSESDLTFKPELDEDYHDLLKFKLIQQLASQGHNPDTDIADYWENEYQERLKKIKDNLTMRNTQVPVQTRADKIKEYMGGY